MTAGNLLDKVIAHVRTRDYMSGVEREYLRVKSTGEVFTPTDTVRRMLDNIPSEFFLDHTKTFLDNSCGDGQFLGEILIKKLENGSTFEQALDTIYGTDLMIDNVDECRRRLLCGREDLRHIVEKNIQCRDGLKFGYNFEKMGPARQKTEEKLRSKIRKDTVRRKKQEEKIAKKKLKEQQEKRLFGEIIS